VYVVNSSGQGQTQVEPIFNFSGDSLEFDCIALPGDANNDGLVSGSDLIAVQAHFGNAGPPNDGKLPGDANNDGLVTGLDLIAVQQNFGNALASRPPPSTAVPEPGSSVLVGLAALTWLRRRHVNHSLNNRIGA
jgi:hypothetical protein